MGPSLSSSISLHSDQPVTLTDVQEVIRQTFGAKDGRRGAEATFMWFAEEVGELAAALREDDQENLAAEFADVLAWLATLANIAQVDLTAAFAKKYVAGCPACQKIPCQCPDHTKP